MARSNRAWVSQSVGAYHIISRVAGGELIFNKRDKETFLRYLEKMAAGFFVEIHAFCIMDNHFHILATELHTEAEDASEQELLDRYRAIYGKNADPPVGSSDSSGQLYPDEDGGIERLRKRLGSISRFVQELKQSFSKWYNKKYERTGYLWGNRFKGVIVQRGEGLLACSAYIDLNPNRAKMEEKPENYPWCSLGMRVRSPRRARQLLHPLAILPAVPSPKEDFRTAKTPMRPHILWMKGCTMDHYFGYRDFVYFSGGMTRTRINSFISDFEKGVQLFQSKLKTGDKFRYRVRNFSEGLAIGSIGFIRLAQKCWNRKVPQPRSFMDGNWSYSTRVLRL